MRPKGVVVYRTLEQQEVLAAEKQQKQDREDRRVAAIERRENRVLLNKHTYAWLYEEWTARASAGGTTKLPRCKRCEAVIHWEEPAHVCPGFQPKYAEHDEEWHERMELLREDHGEAIDNAREDRRYERLHTCKRCGEQVEPDDEHQCERLQCEDCGEWVTQDECCKHQESCRGHVKF